MDGVTAFYHFVCILSGMTFDGNHDAWWNSNIGVRPEAYSSKSLRGKFTSKYLWVYLRKTLDEQKTLPLFSIFFSSATPQQGRIRVRGGPRLDTVMGPYLSFSSYQVIIDYATHTEFLGYRPLENFKLQMPV